MPDRVVLTREGEVQRRPRRASITAPYESTAAHVHLYAAEIAGRLRSTVTAAELENGLEHVATEFGADRVVVQIAGVEASIDHWVTDHRLVRALQTAIDEVYDARLPG